MVQFKSKINILSIASTPGAMGSTETETVLYRNLPCRINWKSGSQRILFDKDTYFRDGVIYCRVVAVTTENRIRYGSVIYEIVDVHNADEVGRFLVLTIKLVE